MDTTHDGVPSGTSIVTIKAAHPICAVGRSDHARSLSPDPSDLVQRFGIGGGVTRHRDDVSIEPCDQPALAITDATRRCCIGGQGAQDLFSNDPDGGEVPCGVRQHVVRLGRPLRWMRSSFGSERWLLVKNAQCSIVSTPASSACSMPPTPWQCAATGSPTAWLR